MKKLFTLGVTFLFLLSVTACSNKDADMGATDTMNYKIGVATHTVTHDSASSSETSNGKGVVTTTTVTLVLDNSNVIKKIHIDEIETKLYFDTLGQLSQSNNSTIKSKKELGDDYNMKPASPIGKEWYEQIDSLEKHLVGKKITDVISGVSYDNISSNTNSMSDSNLNIGSGQTQISNSGSMNNSGTSSALINSGVMGDISGIASDIVDGAEDIVGGAIGGVDSDIMSKGNSSDYNSGGNMNWTEDLKASVTIDLTEIKIAIKKAYENAM